MTATSKEANPLTSVDAWLYHLGEVDDQRAREIAVSGADLIVMDYADDDQRPYAPARLDAVRGDGDKLVVSYLSVGEAEEYRSYWERNWNDAPPSFLFNANPEWPDNYKVAYWDEQWREIVFDYVDDIVEAGFDGLYLDILDAYEFWEKTDPRQGDIYRSEMVRFVADIRAHAETRLREIGDERNFILIGQNAEELAADPAYLEAVDGIGKEDLFFTYEKGAPETFGPVPTGWLEDSLALLEKAEDSEVEVFVIEYVPPFAAVGAERELDRETRLLKDMGIPLYVARERDLLEIYDIGEMMDGMIRHGGAGADLIRGGSGADLLNGRSGRDSLHGGEGNDDLRGGNGADRLYGGPGADLLRGGGGHDVLLGGGGLDSLQGGRGHDALHGSVGGDRLSGGPGSDTLHGGGGTDTVYGGNGNDTLHGGRGTDRLYGGAKSDLLKGGDGRDILIGNWGDDRLDGGGENDLLRGGAGADRFLHAGPFAGGSDRIVDYLATQGDLLIFRPAGAAPEDFAVTFSDHLAAGDPDTAEILVHHLPSDRVLWTLVDGAALSEIHVSLGASNTIFDLFE